MALYFTLVHCLNSCLGSDFVMDSEIDQDIGYWSCYGLFSPWENASLDLWCEKIFLLGCEDGCWSVSVAGVPGTRLGSCSQKRGRLECDSLCGVIGHSYRSKSADQLE